MSTTASQGGPPTIASHDDSTIDSKIFEWDDEIVNADIYRRAMKHAKSKSDMAAKLTVERDEILDAASQVGTEESNDRRSPNHSPFFLQHRKPLPYEMSFVSEPIIGQQPRIVIPNSSVSDRPASRRSILSYRQKTPDTEKKSFWSAISGIRSGHKLLSPDRDATSESTGLNTSTSGSRRGRRGFENSYHTSIDFGSEDGLSAPPLVRAAQAGSVVEVEMLLNQRADINAQHVQSGRSALSVAAHCGNDEVVRLLLQYGAKANERDASQLTPLHLASLRGHVDIVVLLLQEHVDIDVKGPNDHTPLLIAAGKSQIEVAELLLRKEAKVNARDSKQMTPLHIAAKQGDDAMTELLVNNGAHVEAKDSNFMGPLHYACDGGHTGVIGILLNRKAEVEAPGKASMTPLLCASSSGKANAVELLLKKRASVKHRGEGEMTALHWASYNGHVEVVDLLLHRRAPIAAPNKDGRTPLHLAVMAQQFAVADLLLRKGAPTEAHCKHVLKPIHYACLRGTSEITQLLLGYNANIEAEDHAGDRPLHNACTRGSQPHVEALVQKGVNIDARNANGDRPLCLASSMGHVEIVKILLNRGAALRSKFSTGPSHEDSPLCLAARNGHAPVVEELLKRGASVLQKDERDWQPLRYAAFNAHPDVVELLLKHGATVSGSASGGWGFNITAQRIGFANDLTDEKQRKSQVLHMLTSAEARERSTQITSSVATPYVPPAVQNQVLPIELPNPNTATSPPAQAVHPPPAPKLPTARQEMHSEPINSPRGTYTYLPVPQSVNAATSPQTSQHFHPSFHAAPKYTEGGVPDTFAQAFPTPMPSNQSHYPQGYPNPMPNPVPPEFTPQPYAPTTYTFGTPTVPSNHLDQAVYYRQVTAMPNNTRPTTAQLASTMTLGPDGMWQQAPTASIQRAPSGRNGQSPAAPVAYPSGAYELAS